MAAYVHPIIDSRQPPGPEVNFNETSLSGLVIKLLREVLAFRILAALFKH